MEERSKSDDIREEGKAKDRQKRNGNTEEEMIRANACMQTDTQTDETKKEGGK